MVVHPSSVSDYWSTPRSRSIACVSIGVALVVITGLAAYLCLTRGFTIYDTTQTALGRFGGAFLIYSGAAFSLVAVVNALYLGIRAFSGTTSDYTKDSARIQIAASVLAPIAFIPLAVCYAIPHAMK